MVNNDYKLYEIDPIHCGIDHDKLVQYVDMSKAKFEHLFDDKTHNTGFYYLYNFFSIASCNKNTYNLYLAIVKCIKDYFEVNNIPKDNVWMQMWMNIHDKDQVLKSHSHDFPYHGYFSLTPQKTDTVFQDKINGKELYRIQNNPYQVYIGVGNRPHYVDVLEDYTDKRITFGFDIQTNELVTGNFSFIPIVL